MSNSSSDYITGDVDKKYEHFLRLAREGYRRFFSSGTPLKKAVELALVESRSIETFQALAMLRAQAVALRKYIEFRTTGIGRIHNDQTSSDVVFVISKEDHSFILNDLMSAVIEISSVLDGRSSGESFSFDLMLAEQGINIPIKYEFERLYLKLAVEWFLRCGEIGYEDFLDFLFDEDQGYEINDSMKQMQRYAEPFLNDDAIWSALELAPLDDAKNINKRRGEILPILLHENKMNSRLREVFAEACRSYVLGNPRAGTALCRTLLEMMIKDRAGSLGIKLTWMDRDRRKHFDLADLIPDFHKILGPQIGDAMTKVRVNGNFAVHADRKGQDDARSDNERCVESLDLVRRIAAALYPAV